MKTLKQAKVGDTVTVVKLHGEGAVKRRIMDMGITKGVTVYVMPMCGRLLRWAIRWKSTSAATSCRSVRPTPK